MNVATQMLIIRVGLRRVAAGCDRDFDRARGFPRQAVLRNELELRRTQRALARGKSRATHKVEP